MRESLNYNNNMIPIDQDKTELLSFNTGSRMDFITNVSSNAYYGYQPQIHSQESVENKLSTPMNNELSDMDVQFTSNNIVMNGEEIQTRNNIMRLVNRKRRGEYGYGADMDTFKKRRQNANKTDHGKNRITPEKGATLEDILMATHGTSIYHWFGSEA